MDIAIIGAGNVGRSLATSFVRAGHAVVIASRDPEDAGRVAAATGATAASNAEPRPGRDLSCSPPPSRAPRRSPRDRAVRRRQGVVDATNRMSFGADDVQHVVVIDPGTGQQSAAGRVGVSGDRCHAATADSAWSCWISPSISRRSW